MQFDYVNAMNVMKMLNCKFSEKCKKRDFCDCVIMNEYEVLARNIDRCMSYNAIMTRNK